MDFGEKVLYLETSAFLNKYFKVILENNLCGLIAYEKEKYEGHVLQM